MDVKTLCLGVLAERPMTGYEIKKLFEEAFRHFFLAGYGSIYPALAELARDGLVTVESVEQDKRPDKKVYRITPAGRGLLVRELAATEPRHKVRSEFLALVYFAHLLPPERLEAVLDSMIAHWERTLALDLGSTERRRAERGCPPLTPGMRFGLGFGRTMLTTAIGYVKEHRAELLAEQAVAAATGSPPARAAE